MGLPGALLDAGVDVLARVLLAPQEPPIAIVTGVVGGLLFVGPMRHSAPPT